MIVMIQNQWGKWFESLYPRGIIYHKTYKILFCKKLDEKHKKKKKKQKLDEKKLEKNAFFLYRIWENDQNVSKYINICKSYRKMIQQKKIKKKKVVLKKVVLR